MIPAINEARVAFFSGITSVLSGKFIIQAVHCAGGAGLLVDGDGNTIADFSSEGSIPFYTKFEVDGMQKVGGALSDMYVYLDASEGGGQ